MLMKSPRAKTRLIEPGLSLPEGLLAGSLMAAFLLLAILSLRHRTLTYDEPSHYRYGRRILEGDANRFDDSKMPITALNALPAKLAEQLPKGPLDSLLSRFNTARAVTIVTGALLGCLVFLWARQLYGRAASALALAFFAFEPTVIAHSGLVTTDVFVTGFMTLTIYLYWRYSRRGDTVHALLIGLTLGLSLISKYTAMLLPLILLLLALVRGMPSVRSSLASRSFAGLRRSLARGAVHSALAGLVALLVVNAGFLFRKTFTPLSSYRLRSDLLRSVQRTSPSLASLPLPVPYPFLEGLDWVYAHDSTNLGGTKRYYLFGQLSHEPFVGYFSVAYLFKAPLAGQLALGLACVSLIRRRREASFFNREIFLICPLVVLTLYYDLIANLQLGVRYFLVAFPFVIVFSSRIAANWGQLARWQRYGIVALVLCQFGSVLSYFPHYISYVNELIPDRTQAYKVLADSNLDWNQSGWYIGQYLRQHPEATFEPSEPTSGLVLVRVNQFVGVLNAPNYDWLKQCCEPVGTVAYSVLVFDVKPGQIGTAP
jgi:4-amino-4-deoxy-L-arabinose transferase-like glycosyltransferase